MTRSREWRLTSQRARPSARRARALGAALLLAAVSTLRAQTLSFTSSVQLARGRYFFPATVTSAVWLNRWAIEGRRVSAAVTVPLVTQDAGWVQWGGTGGLATGGMPGHRGGGENAPRGGGSMGGSGMMRGDGTSGEWHLAVGDPVIAGEAQIWSTPSGGRTLRTTAQVKVPVTSPDEGVSTGQVDVAAGAVWSARGTRTGMEVGVTAWRLGRVAGVPLRDPVWGSLSLTRVLDDPRWVVMGFANGSTAPVDGASGAALVGAGVGWARRASRRLFLSLGFGLTNASPKVSVAFGTRWERAR